MMKKQKQKVYHKPKRTTFLRLFVRGLAFSLAATGIFAGCLFSAAKVDIEQQVKTELIRTQSQILTGIANQENGKINKSMKSLQTYLAVYTTYHAMTMNFIEGQFVGNLTENCPAASRIIDTEGNVLYSSKEVLRMDIYGSDEEGEHAGIYLCDGEKIPELLQVVREMESRKENPVREGVRVNVKSAYIDKENMTFIPYETEVIRYQIERTPSADGTIEETILESQPVIVQSEYQNQAVTFTTTTDREKYPYAESALVAGTEAAAFDEIFSNEKYKLDLQNSNFESMRGLAGMGVAYGSSVPVWVNGKQCYLQMEYRIDIWNNITKKAFFAVVEIFFLLSVLLDIIFSLFKNKLNRTAYQFEDYRQTLINNLAHDMKTPLMAIRGYTENILGVCRVEDKPKEYLQAILENVDYTNSVINQALELNQIQAMHSVKKTTCDLRSLTENAFRKYALLLQEHEINVNIEGNAEIMANLETLTSAIENLISNAVKYTPPKGEIHLRIDKQVYHIDNTVNGKIDTSVLLMPFTKSDTSRTRKNGSGLGLTIVENALQANGFRLEISCTEELFTAEIYF